ncbi:MAG TPA: hypothetical protein VJN18_22250 [Polyangiaceae bacterium]|nr:hypothetical protein [Polyangiaceae bacterium]
MRLVVVSGWVALVLMGVAACGDDGGESSPPVKCGAGTALRGDTCVTAGGAGTQPEPSSGGEPPSSSAGKGGATMVPPGGSDAGGVVSTDAGGAGGGDGEVGAGGVSEAGSGGSPGGEGGADSEPIDPLTPVPPRWLVFAGGEAAYDTMKFPSLDGLVALGTASLSLWWSRDGRRLIHRTSAGYHATDMTSDAPGTPVLLVSNLLAAPSANYPGSIRAIKRFGWSGDTLSVSTISATTLYVMDPSTAAPALNPITTSLVDFTWAPRGDRLLYEDATGLHVVSVVAGVPGQPQALDASVAVWSPTGEVLAGAKAGAPLLIDVSGAQPVYTPLATPTTGAPSAVGFAFSPDGSKLAYHAAHQRQQPDAFYINVGAVPSAPIQVHQALGATNSAFVSFAPWSSDGRWLLYSVNGPDGGEHVADVSGDQAGPSLPFLTSNATRRWATNAPKLISEVQGRLDLLDLTVSQPADRLLTAVAGVSGAAPSPSGVVAAYSTASTLHFHDLEGLATPTTDISLTVANITWSPDSQFVAVRTSNDHMQLIRMTGVTPSTPVQLTGGTTGIPDGLGALRWQP